MQLYSQVFATFPSNNSVQTAGGEKRRGVGATEEDIAGSRIKAGGQTLDRAGEQAIATAAGAVVNEESARMTTITKPIAVATKGNGEEVGELDSAGP